MANFNIISAEYVQVMSYEDYSVNEASPCGGDAIQRYFKFNDLTGDYIVGRNYTNSLGNAAKTLRILSFNDMAQFVDVDTNAASNVPGYTPNQLKNLSTDTLITFPYDILISNLSQLGEKFNTLEIPCPDNTKHTTRRSRKVEYQILDTANNVGPTQAATFSNTIQ